MSEFQNRALLTRRRHTADLQLGFDCTERCEWGTGNTYEAQALAKTMIETWPTFAAIGNPSIPGLEWKPNDPESKKAMIWDNYCRMASDPDPGAEARKIILS